MGSGKKLQQLCGSSRSQGETKHSRSMAVERGNDFRCVCLCFCCSAAWAIACFAPSDAALGSLCTEACSRFVAEATKAAAVFPKQLSAVGGLAAILPSCQDLPSRPQRSIVRATAELSLMLGTENLVPKQVAFRMTTESLVSEA